MASEFATSDRWFSPAMVRTEPNREYLIAARAAAAAVKPSAEELAAPGPKIAEQLHRRRLATITAVREQFGPDPGAG